MEISKSGARRIAKKALAILSAAAMLIPGGISAYVAGSEQTGITANAASAVATKLKVLDENGKDLGDNAVFYLDNSKANKDNITQRKFKVVASNDAGMAVDDEIRIFADGGASDYIKIIAENSQIEEMPVTILGGYEETKNNVTTWKALKPGTTHLKFTTAGGEVYRSVTVVVYEPATDMKLYQVTSKGKAEFNVNDDNPSNAVNIMTIANHKYQFGADKVNTTSTDTVEWSVYDGYYTGADGSTPKQTNKAEITQNGLFTPKINGEVTIVAKYKATETSKRNKSYGKKKIGDTLEENVLNVPKYLHVTIVKENPATDLVIKNAPEAMEIGDTMKLAIESTPTYNGVGYESGATDVFTWKSSNPKVVTVDEEGNITAVGKGDAKITVYAESENVRAEADIKVLTKAQSISFNAQTTSTRVGVDTVVTATMNPDTADEEIVWTSSNPSVASVQSLVTGAFTNSQSAVISGLKVGSTIITARAKNSGVEAKITCNVTKKIDAADIVLTSESNSVISNIYDGSTVTVFDQKQIKINGILKAADGTTPDDSLEWEVIGNGVNNGDYVTIDSQDSSSITLTGFARGTVTIKASSKNNSTISKSFNLQVLKRATKSVIINNGREDQKFNKNLNVGSTLSLSADLTIATNQPYDHDDRIAHWTSSNTAAVEVDDKGFVTVVGNGSAILTAIAESGLKQTTTLTGFTTSSIVIKGVNVKTDGSLPDATIALSRTMAGVKQLSAVVNNQKDAVVSDVMIDWSSDNEEVATVDATGKVTAHNLGECIITAKSGNKTDKCIIYVQYPLGNATVTVAQATYIPGVTEYKPEVDVSYSYTETDMLGQSYTVTVKLQEGVDYLLAYSNNTAVGLTGSVVITGLGNYSSSVTKTFRITARPINDVEVMVDPVADQELTPENKSTGVMPDVVIYHQGYKLVSGTDYTITYRNNRVVGTAQMTIAGKGNYSGQTTVSFNIFCKHEHKTFYRTAKQATCVQEGQAEYKCDACGQVFTEVIPMVDHKWVAVSTVEPTLEAGGYTLYRCSVCKEEKKADLTPKLVKLDFTKCTLKVNDTAYSYTATNMKAQPNDNITLNCQATGGTKPYMYAFYYKLSTAASWTKVGTEWGTDRTATFKAPKDGVYDVKVAIKDSGKQTAEKVMTLTVKTNVLNNTSVINSDIVQIGDKVRVSGSANGGAGGYTYAYYYKRSTATNWNKLGTEFGTNTSVAFQPTAEATYDVKVIVKDKNGVTAEKTFTVKSVKELALTNVSVVGRENIKLGTAIPMIGKAVGGAGEPYTYSFYFKRTTNTNWKLLGDKFQTTASARFKPTATGTYDIRIDVKDSKGTIAKKFFTATVK